MLYKVETATVSASDGAANSGANTLAVTVSVAAASTASTVAAGATTLALIGIGLACLARRGRRPAASVR